MPARREPASRAVRDLLHRSILLAAHLALVGWALGCAPPDHPLVPVAVTPRYAVVFSDYDSSAITLLDADLSVIASDWVTSGTRTPILVTAVTGDAVLPSAPLGDGLLAWINRLNADVVTLVDPTAPDPLLQLDVHGEGPATSWSANPHDALRLPDGRLLISRHNPDPTFVGTAMARGNDLVAIDLATHAMERVELGCDEGEWFARPDQLAELRVAERPIVLVALARLGANFRTFGEGAVASLDAETLRVLDCAPLPGAVNCQYVRAVPGAPNHAVVLCTGDPFQPEATRRDAAAVLEISVDDTGSIAIGDRLDARGLPEGLVPTAFPLPLGDGTLLAISDARAEEITRVDHLLRIDLRAGTVEVIAESEPFTIGAGTYVHGGGAVLVPDGASDTLIVYDVTMAAIVDRIAVPTSTGLPMVQVGQL